MAPKRKPKPRAKPLPSGKDKPKAETIVLAFAQKEAEAMEDWARRSLESTKYLGPSEPRF